jgi:hypothetical protein
MRPEYPVRLRTGVGRDFAVDILENRLAILGTQLFDDVRQIGRVHVLQQPVRNVEPQATLRIGLQNIAELPADRPRRDARLNPPDPARRQALQHSPENAADPDIDFEHPQLFHSVVLTELQREIVDAHYLAALRVDDLLIQKIAGQAQHVLVE